MGNCCGWCFARGNRKGYQKIPDHIVADTTRIRKSRKNITDFYKIDSKTLGKGTFGVVKLGYSLSTNEKVAIKVINRRNLAKFQEDMMRKEVKIMRSLKHPNIVKCYDYFETDENFYIVMELLPGGELFERIMEKSYSERRARDTIAAVLKGMKYCHDRNIAHRDMKPENLLLTTIGDDADIKITDFGFATQAEVSVNKKLEMHGKCGTADYVAPEILNASSYDVEVDMWSIGCITYVLLSGSLPFFAEDEGTVFEKIKFGKYNFDDPVWQHISEEAKDFISHLLEYDPTKRFTCDEAMGHVWLLKKFPDDAPIVGAAETYRRQSMFQAEAAEEYRYNLTKQFRVLVKAVVAVNKFKSKTNSACNTPSDTDDER